MKIPIAIIVMLSMCCAFAYAQTAPVQNQDNDPISEWMRRSAQADAEQPHWVSPMFTMTPRLVQQFRYDVSQQTKGNLTTTSYGNGKGFEFVPTEHIQFLISAPPYLAHSSSRVPDGFGDMAFMCKYRIASGNEQHGTYVVTALLPVTIPTGSYSNGAAHAQFTPTFGLGKGWRNFDVQSTIGLALPTGDIGTLGTPVAFNSAFQYRLLKKLWPEVELNSTFWGNGNNAGKKQVFLSPGLVLGRLHLWRRLGFAVGGGVQIAATRFHTYNHNWLFSVRFPF